MSKTAADVLVQTLLDWEVDTVFGIPGDGINGIIEAFRLVKDKIKFVQVRHEEAAAFMACGYAKYTGKLGVCVATSGPGGIHLLNGLYDAKMDGIPVLAITGLQFHDLVHTYTQQDVELDKLFMDACVYNNRIMGAAHVENTMNLACRTALSRKGPAHVTMPVDLQSLPASADTRSERNVPHHVSLAKPADVIRGQETAIRQAAEILNAGEKVCILAGRGALEASDELASVAETLNAPVATALLGKGAISDLHPNATGGVGLLGTTASHDALKGCDTLLIVGSSFPYVEFYPEPGAARAVQIDRDGARIGLRYPVECGIVGDARPALSALLPMLKKKRDEAFLQKTRDTAGEWRDALRAQGTVQDLPMKPQVLAYELNRLVPTDAIIATDSGTNTSWCARFIEMRGDMKFSVSGNLASMACGLPYANAAAIAYPDRPVIAFVGDGGLSMLMAELATTAKYHLNVKVVVVKNNSLGQIKWEQISFLGNPEYVCDLHPIDFAKVAEACGIRGYSITDPALCETTLREALGAPGPAVIEAVVDPDEPPLPAHTTFAQAKNFVKAIARGTQHGGDITEKIAREKVRQLI
jgi:pyruvate dehydrogenase (quinone)/pyruvate oxidase